MISRLLAKPATTVQDAVEKQVFADGPDRGTTAAVVKGFGCRPVVTYLRALRAGVRKPPRKEPAGAGRQLALMGI